MACDRSWELCVTLDAKEEAEASRDMSEQFSREEVRAVDFFSNIVTESWEPRADGTSTLYWILPRSCQGCERRYVQGEAQATRGMAKFPLAAESEYKLTHCMCGLTKANITWALTHDIFREIARK